jgi:hypothetical protein
VEDRVDARNGFVDTLAGGEISLAPLDVSIVPWAPCENAHRMAVAQEPRSNSRAEMSSAAGHENLHRCLSRIASFESPVRHDGRTSPCVTSPTTTVPETHRVAVTMVGAGTVVTAAAGLIVVRWQMSKATNGASYDELRRSLFAIAHRMLGRVTGAEDV